MLTAAAGLDLTAAYATALRGADRVTPGATFVDVYDHRDASRPNVDVVVVALSAQTVETAAAAALLSGAVATFDAGGRRGLLVAVFGATAGLLDRVNTLVGVAGASAEVHPVSDADEFREVVQGALCAFGRQTPTGATVDDAGSGTRFPMGTL